MGTDQKHIDGDEQQPLRQVVTAAGRDIYQQGAAAFQAFYIEEGRVAVTVQDGSHTVKLGELGPGEIFGDIGVFMQEPHKTTVTALENTIVSVLKKEDLEERLQSIDDKYIQAMIKSHIHHMQETRQAYLECYKRMTDLQMRMMGLSSTLENGISEEKRQAFSEEVLPFLEAIQKVLEKHKN